MTGTSAAVPEGQLPSKSLTSNPGEPSANPGDWTAEAPPGVAQRATSQRATSFVGTADYVAPEVMAVEPASMLGFSHLMQPCAYLAASVLLGLWSSQVIMVPEVTMVAD